MSWLRLIVQKAVKNKWNQAQAQVSHSQLSGAQMDYHRPTENSSQENSGPVLAMQKTVLVVEDNELNMKLFNDLLEAHGYKVVQTRDGLSAL